MFNRISICICTFRRTSLLAQLLHSLSLLTHEGIAEQVEIVVADNDPANSAKPILMNWIPPSKFSLVHVHVPVANISLARNATVSAATGQWIAFIDDDETPSVDWLKQLLNAQQTYHADAVFAPVVPRYVAGTPDWIIKGAFFDRRRFATGSPIDERDARTGNVLIAAAKLKALDGPFDAQFGRTGGEDSLLFRDLLATGCRFIWCDEAPVEEEVPLARANAKWLIQRSYRVGQTWIRAELYRLKGLEHTTHSLYLSGRAVVQLMLCLPLFFLTLIWSREQAFVWVRKAAMQMGKLTGMTKYQYKEYGH